MVEQTVRSIDLLPTLVQLSGLTPPETFQGHSLAAFLTGKESTLDPLPAFSERMRQDGPETHESSDSYAVVAEGWKLIHNVRAAAGVPEFELFDHSADPLNLKNLAGDHPEIVTRLSETLNTWKEMATAAKLEGEMDTEGLSPQELERLRSLGYIR